MKEYVGAELLTEWQTRLGLHDWTIKLIDNCNPDEMTIQDAVGCTDWTESSKVARIEIIDPQYYGNRILPFDYEKTLVHELLHLKTCLVSDMVSDLQTRFMHQLIDDLARAFVDAKRGTVSKSAEVVRCKDCKWFNKIGCAIMVADDSDKPTENDFCSFAQKATLVRCGTCKWLKPDGTCKVFADSHIRPSASDFCSYGERRTE